MKSRGTIKFGKMATTAIAIFIAGAANAQNGEQDKQSDQNIFIFVGIAILWIVLYIVLKKVEKKSREKKLKKEEENRKLKQNFENYNKENNLFKGQKCGSCDYGNFPPPGMVPGVPTGGGRCNYGHGNLKTMWDPACKDYVPKKGCFITTACCEVLGKADDCYELTTFRDFRDNWLRHQNGGESLIKEYYEIAPKIVKAINESDNSINVYLQIWEQYLKDCLSCIEMKDFEKCKTIYVSMCEELKNKYIEKITRSS